MCCVGMSVRVLVINCGIVERIRANFFAEVACKPGR